MTYIKLLFSRENFFILLFPCFIILPEVMDIGPYSLKTTFFTIIAILGIITYILYSLIHKKKVKIELIDILLILYAVLILLSCLNAVWPRDTIWGTYRARGEGIVTLYGYLLCFFIASKIYTKSKLVEGLTTTAVVIISIVGIVQALIGRYFGFEYSGDIVDGEYMAYGTMINPNFFSTVVTIFLPIYIISYLHKKDNKLLCVIGIVFGGLVCSKSLSGYVTFIIYTLVIFIYYIIASNNKKEIVKQILSLLIIFITVFTVLNVINDNKYFEELKIIKADVKSASESSEEFGNNRGYIWSMCLEIISKRPIFGVGPDLLGGVVVNYYMNQDDYFFDNIMVDKAHNEYLHIAVTTGIPSLIVYLSILVVILISLLKKFIWYVRNKKRNSAECAFLVAISASILAYLVQAIVNISVTCVAPMFWCILGIGYNIAKRRE